ncbi:ClbS/DfsB family four-helix bundle protein [Paenibacillus sp. BIHB 4019]|nr:ClbS/DfsB family four-helix bundle protein [Paenibacillus sp. BIHB 4019]
MPSPDHKWNQLGGLYQSFYERYSAYSLSELRDLFRKEEQRWLE